MRAVSDKAFREHLKTLWVRPGRRLTEEEIDRRVRHRKLMRKLSKEAVPASCASEPRPVPPKLYEHFKSRGYGDAEILKFGTESGFVWLLPSNEKSSITSEKQNEVQPTSSQRQRI